MVCQFPSKQVISFGEVTPRNPACKMWKTSNSWNLQKKFTCVALILFASAGVQPLTISHQPASDVMLTPTTVHPDTIGQLEGEAGYRMATLQWKFPATAQDKVPTAFRVRYCERHSWGLDRCRYQTVDSEGNSSPRTGRKDKTQQSVSKTLIEKNGVYKIDIGGLRMATNYSFEIMPKPQEWENFVEGGTAQISLQTKGFSAKASSCLADSSVVVVETGPFFGGRISVENSQSPSCALKGDPQSPATQYTLKIGHEECGSTVNNSKVTTVILVQENLPILTHSTRRFVVVCTFSPESFIVKAGVNLPRGSSSVAKSMDFSQLVRVPSQNGNGNILVARKEGAGIGTRRGVQHRNITEEVKAVKDADADEQTQLQDLDNVSAQDNDQAAEESSVDADTDVADAELADGSAEYSKAPDEPPVQSISGLQEFRQRQSRAYLQNSNSQLNNNQLPGQESRERRPLSLIEPRGRGSGHDEGTVEGYVVFGMVVLVIVCGLASVLWFIKSSYKSGAMVGTEHEHHGVGDDNSSISGGSSSGRTSHLSSVCNGFQLGVGANDGESSLDSQYDHQHSMPPSFPDRAPRNLDTRSELEVELDFEFSEEINTDSPASAENSNSRSESNNSFVSSSPSPKRFTLQLDETCQQLSSASHA